MHQFVFIAHILICLALIGLILIQQGKGSDAGLMSGGGSQTVFGSAGAHSFLVKITAATALLFFMTCLGLGYFSNHVSSAVAVPAVQQQPATKAPAPVKQPAPVKKVKG